MTTEEWVEVYNAGSNPFEFVAGAGAGSFRFSDGSLHTITLSQGTTTLASQDFVIFASDATTWLAEHTSFTGTVFDTVMSLKNSSSTLGLALTKDDPLFSVVTYESSWGASGNGTTLEIADLSQFLDSATGWRESTVRGGTPGYWESSDTTATSTDDTEEPPPDDESDDQHDATATSTDECENEETDGERSDESGGSSSHDADWSFAIRISELMPNLEGSDDAEWIELPDGLRGNPPPLAKTARFVILLAQFSEEMLRLRPFHHPHAERGK